MLQGVQLRRSDVIVPIFVREGANVRHEVSSMPGVYQMSLDVALPWLAARAEEGFLSYLIFGVIDRAKKDAMGTPALDENNRATIARTLLARLEPQMPGEELAKLSTLDLRSRLIAKLGTP